MTELVVQGQGCRLTATALELPENMTVDEWLQIGVQLRNVEKSLQWWIGDWLNHGERLFDEMASQALEGSHRDYRTLMNWRYVASRVAVSRRRDNLPWSTHAEVAPLDPEVQEMVLKEASEKKMSKLHVRQVVQRLAGKELKEQPARHCPNCGFVLTDQK